MSYQHPAQAQRPTDNHRGLRLLALTAVVVGLMLLAAAAFVLSYAGIHEVALTAGVSPRWARLYPVIFDAMLVIASAAVLSLRGAGLPSRCYAWLTMLVLFAAAAGADTVHATDITLPPRPTAAAAAIIPWALVLVGFGLLLCMLRQARLRRAAAAAAPERVFPERSGHVEVRAGHEGRTEAPDRAGPATAPGTAAVTAPAPRPALPSTTPAAATPSLAAPQTPGAASPSSPTTPPPSPTTPPPSPATPPPSPATPPASPVTASGGGTSGGADAAVDPELDLALEADPGPDDPASDEGSTWLPGLPDEQPAQNGLEPGGPRADNPRADNPRADNPRADDRPASAFSPAPTLPAEAETDGSASDPEPDDGNEASRGFVAKATGGARISQFPPHPRLAPEAMFESESERAPGTTPQPQSGQQPTPEAALRPEAEVISRPGPGKGGEDAPPGAGKGGDEPPGAGDARDDAPGSGNGKEDAPDSGDARGDAPARRQPDIEAEPEAAAQADTQPQPVAAAQPQQDAEPRPVAAAQPQPSPGPDPGAAARPEPQPEKDAASKPQPEKDAASKPQPDPSPDAQPAPPPDPRPVPDAQPTKHTPPQPRPAPESGASHQTAPPPEPEPAQETEEDLPAETKSGPDAGADSASTSGADPETESDAAPPQVPPQFDRMRSSPVPPEA
jgi:Protein of unknown function (DUF2637)